MITIHIPGHTSCTFFNKAVESSKAFVELNAEKFAMDVKEVKTHKEFDNLLPELRKGITDEASKKAAEAFKTCPFVSKSERGENVFIGGCDELIAFLGKS